MLISTCFTLNFASASTTDGSFSVVRSIAVQFLHHGEPTITRVGRVGSDAAAASGAGAMVSARAVNPPHASQPYQTANPNRATANTRFTHRIHAPGFGSTDIPAVMNGQGSPMPAPSTNGSATAHTRPAANHFAVRTSVASRIGAMHAPARTAVPAPRRNGPTSPRFSRDMTPGFGRGRNREKSIKNTSLVARPSTRNTTATTTLNHGFDWIAPKARPPNAAASPSAP